VRHLIRPLLQLGLAGLVLMGVADSSFLVAPFGNDLLVVILIAREHDRFIEYVLAASAGSVLGISLLDFVCRKGGEKGLLRMLDKKRFTFLKDQIERHGAVAIALACVAPPPFPFTAVIAASSAFQYPRRKLLAIAFSARFTRYCLVGWAAIEYGRHILRITRTPEFFWSMVAFISACAIATAFSVAGWIRRGRIEPAVS
jgi:membrane protein YqaA with SNARE-associated domain